jgi:hypothetical protein
LPLCCTRFPTACNGASALPLSLKGCPSRDFSDRGETARIPHAIRERRRLGGGGLRSQQPSTIGKAYATSPRRSFCWQVQLRRDVVAPPLILLLYVRLIYGIAPLPPLGPYWISTSFVPTLVMMVLFNNLQKRSVDRFRLRPAPGLSRRAPRGIADSGFLPRRVDFQRGRRLMSSRGIRRDWIAALGRSDVPSGYSGARVITELTRASPSMVGDPHQRSIFRKPPVLGLAHLEPHKTPVRQPVDERDPSIASNFGRLRSCRRAKLLFENAWQPRLL